MAATPGIEKFLLSAADLPPAAILFGSTEAMEKVRQRIESAAATSVPLLICGEDGTGKEMLAKLVHLKSFWSRGPFVKIDCANLSAGHMESELFGYEQCASGGKPSRIRTTHLGTLFLHEIGKLEGALQSRFLPLLDDGRLCRIGGRPERTMEARLISTAGQDADGNLAASPLLQRLEAASITLPPLRERQQDIPGLIEHFCARFNQLFHRNTPPLSDGAVQLLQGYHWPGNIRELENVLRRYVILGQEKLAISDVSGHSEFIFIPDFCKRSDLALKSITRQVKRELERKLILRALEENQWNRKKAASTLKISYRALLYKLRGSGIPSLRAPAAQRRAPGVGKAIGPGPVSGGAAAKLD